MKKTMDELKRRGPKKGYDNNYKKEYRRIVWQKLSEKCLPLLSDENAKVLLLPSKEGIEIDVAISFGIKPEQIIAVDENPALIAVSDWRKKHQTVKYFGCKVSEVGEKIKRKGWYLVSANLDFCNNFCDELIDEIELFLNSGCLSNNYYIAVTMMKGRETKALLKMIQRIGISEIFDSPRLTTLFEVIDINASNIKKIYEGEYFSTSPMVYGIAEVVRSNKILLTQNTPKEVNISGDMQTLVDTEHDWLYMHIIKRGNQLKGISSYKGYKGKVENYEYDYTYLVDNPYWSFSDLSPEDIQSGIEIPQQAAFVEYLNREEIIFIYNVWSKISCSKLWFVFHIDGPECMYKRDCYYIEMHRKPSVKKFAKVSRHMAYVPNGMKYSKHFHHSIDVSKSEYFYILNLLDKETPKHQGRYRTYTDTLDYILGMYKKKNVA